ncbi:nitroreductase family protein, partial [Citrobacter sp. UMB8248A]|nr:nitroreductase family protein [Citrobacter sp. UMB8248A]
MMNVEEAILTRHAVRLFNPDDKISKGSLEKIVELAQHAPSWVDSQPWKVYIATGNTLAAIKKRHAE